MNDRWRAIKGNWVPTGNASAILKQWNYEGYTKISLKLAHAMGLAIVVVRDPADEASLLAEIEREVCGE
jgi:hypothetical protein